MISKNIFKFFQADGLVQIYTYITLMHTILVGPDPDLSRFVGLPRLDFMYPRDMLSNLLNNVDVGEK